MPTFWTCECETVNGARDTHCTACRTPRNWRDDAKPAQTPAEASPGKCHVDGSYLRGDRSCERGGGWPQAALCPFVCEFCRLPISWDGVCYSGCKEGKEFRVGDRYDVINGHWHITEKRGGQFGSHEQNLAAVAIVRRVMQRQLTADQGHDAIGQVFTQPGIPRWVKLGMLGPDDPRMPR